MEHRSRIEPPPLALTDAQLRRLLSAGATIPYSRRGAFMELLVEQLHGRADGHGGVSDDALRHALVATRAAIEPRRV